MFQENKCPLSLEPVIKSNRHRLVPLPDDLVRLVLPVDWDHQLLLYRVDHLLELVGDGRLQQISHSVQRIVADTRPSIDLNHRFPHETHPAAAHQVVDEAQTDRRVKLLDSQLELNRQGRHSNVQVS